MTTKSKVPQIRFKGFIGEWEYKRFDDVVDDLYNGQTPSRIVNSYWNGKINWLSSGELNRSIVTKTIEKISPSGQKNANLRLIPSGTFVMAITGLEATGTRGNCAILGIDTTLNQSCMAIFPKLNLFYTPFLFQWYRKNSEEYGIKFTQGTKQQSYNAAIIRKLDIVLPKVDEQTKISNYFQYLDKLIEQKEKKYQKLKQFKKAMLDKMFPKNGADTPEIRFKGFSGKWEEKRLIEFPNLVHGDGDWILSQDITINGEYKIVQLGNIGLGKYIKKDLKTVSQKTFEDLRGTPIHQGDLLINRMVDGNVNSCIFELNGSYITSVDVCWIRKNDYINNYFLMCLLIIETNQKKLLSLSSGSGRIRISKKNLFEKFDFIIPTTEEQEKIGNYFQKLDNQIDLQQKELEKLKNIKKASLFKMFV